jgi:hypothetical protein
MSSSGSKTLTGLRGGFFLHAWRSSLSDPLERLY